MPVIAAGRIRFPDLAERALAAGQVDFVAIGRGVIADPEWVTKAREGRAAQIRPCVGIVQDCRAAHGLVGCAVNARAGREAEWGAPRRAEAPKRVVVAGAGPAGLEAARVAAESGHDVVVYEQSERHGWAAAGRRRRPHARGAARLRLLPRARARASGRRPAPRDAGDARGRARRGARPGRQRDRRDTASAGLPVRRRTRASVTVWDLLGGKVKEIPARAAVLDDGSGFWHGVSAAEFLAERGAAVELLTPARGVGLAIPHESVAGLHQRLRSNGVRFRPLVTVTAVERDDDLAGGRRDGGAVRDRGRAARRAGRGCASTTGCCWSSTARFPRSSPSATAPRRDASATRSSTPTLPCAASTRAGSATPRWSRSDRERRRPRQVRPEPVRISARDRPGLPAAARGVRRRARPERRAGPRARRPPRRRARRRGDRRLARAGAGGPRAPPGARAGRRSRDARRRPARSRERTRSQRRGRSPPRSGAGPSTS